MDERLDKLGIPAVSPWRKWAWRIGLAVTIVGGLVAAGIYMRSRAPSGPRFATTAITRGELVATVTATGTLRPRNTVEVGPEISGRVRDVNVDANDHVTAGQVLAEIDTTQIDAQVQTARANLASSSAGIRVARAALDDLRTTLRRTEQLHERQLASDAELDQARGAVARAEAEVSAAGARAGVARAELDRISNDLGRARVVSPIDGIVLARNVEPGQSVAATLSSPVFFLIAEDLRELELEVTIDEADIGSVREGMEATFRVDAHQDREFRAIIRRIHFASRTVLNVVTYPAELSVDNAEGLLRPGMTATATIVTERRADQVLVPNAALRFVPPIEQRFGGPRRVTPTGPTVWVLRNGQAEPLAVETRGTDGRNTSVTGEGVSEGVEVITGLAREDQSAPQAR
ncbi:MAG: efflux RND transporter periplasmic adaptor subunit [Sandaracinaceae bacterium]|nr:efflux RND transporter periplasmic adaptor subunit [Sandaracinaceae bacterium]